MSEQQTPYNAPVIPIPEAVVRARLEKHLRALSANSILALTQMQQAIARYAESGVLDDLDSANRSFHKVLTGWNEAADYISAWQIARNFHITETPQPDPDVRMD